MKLVKKILLVMLVCLPILLVSCSKDSSTNPTDPATYSFSCVVNGGGYTNQTFTFSTTAAAVTNPVDNITGCTFTDASGNNAVVTFNGTATGTYSINDSETIVGMTFGNNLFIGLTSGSIKVTTFGNVGGDIIGTFTGSGTVVNNGEEKNVEISKGTFKAKRLT